MNHSLTKYAALFLSSAATVACVSAPRGLNVNAEEIVSLAASSSVPSMQLCVYDKDSGLESTVLAGCDESESSEIRVFQAASLSKPVFSYIVMRLVDEGRMDLDAPVAEYTGTERFTDSVMASQITPRMVLSHTSGLYNWAYSPTSEQWASSPISFHTSPGECFGYSGEAYAFLQRAVEMVSGKSLDDLAKEYVFEPFGMPLSSYGWRSEYDSLAVCGYDRGGKSHGLWEFIRPNCAYTLRTTCVEYLSFLKHAVLGGEGLSEEIYREWLAPRSHAIRFKDNERECDSDMYWCLGMGVKVDFDKDGAPVARQLWHWGDNDYWKSLFVVDLESGVAMDYFTNTAAGHDFTDDVCRSVFGRTYGIQAWIGSDDDL